MDGSEYIGTGVAIIGLLQGLNLYVTTGIKKDITALWKRADNHGHEIECNGSECKPRTHAVVLRGSGE